MSTATETARRPLTLFAVTGLPAITDPDHVGHSHPTDSIVGYVVVRVERGPYERRDVCVYDGIREFAAANSYAVEAMTGAEDRVMYVVDRVYACGARSSRSLPSPDVEAVAHECERGDGYVDPDEGVVECQGQGGGFYHIDCHAAVCSSRVCARENDL
jgi:hypothetical protein